jgi:hypothetical protein
VDPVDELRAHYRAAEVQLLEADTSDLPQVQVRARGEAIASLRAYREAGVFGINTEDPSRRVVAIACHGSLEGVQGLFALTQDGSAGGSTRAAAWHALGFTLQGDAHLELAALSRSSNFRAFPEWTMRALEVPL